MHRRRQRRQKPTRHPAPLLRLQPQASSTSNLASDDLRVPWSVALVQPSSKSIATVQSCCTLSATCRRLMLLGCCPLPAVAVSAAGTMAASQPAELVHLSVGGSAFTTTRTTLCAQPGTLAAMFSGEAQPTLLKDAEGRYFIDR